MVPSARSSITWPRPPADRVTDSQRPRSGSGASTASPRQARATALVRTTAATSTTRRAVTPAAPMTATMFLMATSTIRPLLRAGIAFTLWAHAPRPARPYRPSRLASLSRHHDVRAAMRRARFYRDSRSRGGGRHQLPRHRRRLSAGRHPRDGGPHRGDRGALAARPPPRLRARHLVLGGDGGPLLGSRRLAQAHLRRHRRLVAPARHGLRGSLP